MSQLDLLDELNQFVIDNREFWPDGLISIEVRELIRMEFEFNIQSEAFFKDKAKVFRSAMGGYIATFDNFKVYLNKTDNE